MQNESATRNPAPSHRPTEAKDGECVSEWSPGGGGEALNGRQIDHGRNGQQGEDFEGVKKCQKGAMKAEWQSVYGVKVGLRLHVERARLGVLTVHE